MVAEAADGGGQTRFGGSGFSSREHGWTARPSATPHDVRSSGRTTRPVHREPTSSSLGSGNVCLPRMRSVLLAGTPQPGTGCMSLCVVSAVNRPRTNGQYQV